MAHTNYYFYYLNQRAMYWKTTELIWAFSNQNCSTKENVTWVSVWNRAIYLICRHNCFVLWGLFITAHTNMFICPWQCVTFCTLSVRCLFSFKVYHDINLHTASIVLQWQNVYSPGEWNKSSGGHAPWGRALPEGHGRQAVHTGVWRVRPFKGTWHPPGAREPCGLHRPQQQESEPRIYWPGFSVRREGLPGHPRGDQETGNATHVTHFSGSWKWNVATWIT